MLFSRSRFVIVMAILCIGCMYALPNFLSKTTLQNLPRWIPRKTINLGLDLQGGAQILLEAKIEDLIQDRLNGLKDEVRKILLKNQLSYQDLRVTTMEGGAENGIGSVSFLLKEQNDVMYAQKALKKISTVYQSLQDTQITLFFTEEEIKTIRDSVMERSVEIISRRINELGTKEPSIQRQGQNRILVQIPGVDDLTRIKDIIGKTAKLTFHMVREHTRFFVPGTITVPSYHNGEKVEELVLDKRPLLTGENLDNARPDTDEYNQPRIAFSFDTEGARKFGEITRKNIGKRFAIVLDGKVLVAPVIQSYIPQGQGVITGSYTFQEVHDTSLLMRSGALLAPLVSLEERTVGPNLGADSIAAGKKATLFATFLVFLVMLIIYKLFGVFANIALFFNLILLIGALSAIGATLTLSGIAGIALTLGMSVDANVLIFERIKEETRNGMHMMKSVEQGFKKAMVTIIDSNVTTLIGAALLFQFGSGMLRGFAVTLSFGILISMFTAISLTRLLVAIYLQRWRPKTLSI